MSEELPPAQAEMADAVRLRAARQRRARMLPSLARGLGQIGALGWQIAGGALIGVLIGRWIDHRLGTGIFWTAPLLLVGTGIGCWSAWRWVGRQ